MILCSKITHLQNDNIPVTWQTRQHYKQHYSAMRENKPSGLTPGFATFDPDDKSSPLS